MNVTTEQKEKCIIDLHIELPPERFEQEWKRVVDSYQRAAAIPGFRKGKAPRAAVEKKYAKEMREEAVEHLIKNAVQEVLKDKKIAPAQHPKLQEQHLGEDQSLRLVIQVVTAPEIELPEYRGIEVAVEKSQVDEARVQEYLEKMREDTAAFTNVEDRGLQMGDFAVLDYEGTVEGKSLLELDADLSVSFVGRRNGWLRLEEDRPIPGLAEALVGLKPLETRECKITFPHDFSEEKLRGVEVTYKVTLHEIKVRELVPLDDAFAAKLEPELTLEKLKENIRGYMQQMMDSTFHQNVRMALRKELLLKIPCEVPSTMIEQETASLLQEIIKDNQNRGVSDEEIRAHQEQLMSSAKQGAQEKLQFNYILGAIAAKEALEVTPDEMSEHLLRLSKRYQMPAQKLIKELSKRGALGHIQEEILLGKAFDLLIAQAKVTELPPSNKATSQHEQEHEHVHGPHCNH
ncbi:MAG: trigger factor [Verrucomicrobia bacterium RIFCSPHIGHO2_12_FULL_41_10]|nr:MAG: trigger factor [Verrucomicrobia bacterium RIFCSPHIGHO2_12_FULL_41_10]